MRGNIALIKADRVDPRGNLTYNKTARAFCPVMAMAADHTIVEVREEVALGDIDPEIVVTPGVFVDTYFITGFYEIGKGQ
jgi:3-oxoadipate CoA-transferase alpha subunit